jgi:hypothetical protein
LHIKQRFSILQVVDVMHSYFKRVSHRKMCNVYFQMTWYVGYATWNSSHAKLFGRTWQTNCTKVTVLRSTSANQGRFLIISWTFGLADYGGSQNSRSLVWVPPRSLHSRPPHTNWEWAPESDIPRVPICQKKGLLVVLFACLLVCLFACSLVRLFACSLVRLFACSLVRLFACSLVRLFACSLVRLFACLHVRLRACVCVCVCVRACLLA